LLLCSRCIKIQAWWFLGSQSTCLPRTEVLSLPKQARTLSGSAEFYPSSTLV
jgi:hypothetical protein